MNKITILCLAKKFQRKLAGKHFSENLMLHESGILVKNLSHTEVQKKSLHRGKIPLFFMSVQSLWKYAKMGKYLSSF